MKYFFTNHRPHLARPGTQTSQNGQVVIVFALAAVVIIGIVGLALDAGLGYMNRTTLQGAADTASQAGARLLAADFQAPVTSPPYNLTALTNVVESTLDGSGAGPTAAKSFTGFLVTASKVGNSTDPTICVTAPTEPSAGPNQCIVCWFFTSSTPPPSGVPQCTSLPVAPSTGQLLVDGVEVAPTNSNPTPLLGVLGISQSSQAANATSIFGLPQIAGPPYAVWDACFSTSSTLDPWVTTSGALSYGDYVMYYNNNSGGGGGYQTEAACNSSAVDSSFKGDLHPPMQPYPPSVPGWLSAGSGVQDSTIIGETAGSEFLLPVVDCLQAPTTLNPFPFTAKCPAANVNLPNGCGTTFLAPLTSPTGKWDLCVVGYVYVRAVNDCNTNKSTPSTHCIAQIIQNPNLLPGTLLCDPEGSPNPPCDNAAGTASVESVVVQLYNT